MKSLKVEFESGEVVAETSDGELRFPFESPEAFELVSEAWLRLGWDTKYVYSFTWMGRPIIQLPDDMLRLQEVIYNLKPDVIVETGIAHGGSLIFYASLCKAMGKGRVVGVDVEIRPHNRIAIEEHELSSYITMFEGSSTADGIVEKVAEEVSGEETVLVVLDSCHTKEHVLAELKAYSKLVSPGSWIVACDGIMKDLVGAPRSSPDWAVDNPVEAAKEFVAKNDEFEFAEPEWLFNEGVVRQRVTYWPQAFIRRKSAADS